jgi:hypothetical protein
MGKGEEDNQGVGELGPLFMAHPFEAEFWVVAKEKNSHGHGASVVFILYKVFM